jgi:hypothetical protein
MKLSRKKLRSLIIEVISEGYYIGSEDPSKTTRAIDAHQSGIDMLDKRIASHPKLSTIANASTDDDGLEQARWIAHAKYEDELPDAERAALDIGADKVEKLTIDYRNNYFDDSVDEFIKKLSVFFTKHHDPESMDIYKQEDDVSLDILQKLNLEEMHGTERPVIIITTFDSAASDGSSLGPENFYILLYPGDSKSIHKLDLVTIQNFYHGYETYYKIEEYGGNIDAMVEDLGVGIYRDSGI